MKSVRDKDGNRSYYREDGTIRRSCTKDGNEIYYKEDGKTVDFIKNNDGMKKCDMSSKISSIKKNLNHSGQENLETDKHTEKQTQQSKTMFRLAQNKGYEL